MRHLKKFNEDILYFGDDEPKKKPFDITEALDLEYIKSCFINMIEEYDGEDMIPYAGAGQRKEYTIAFYLKSSVDLKPQSHLHYEGDNINGIIKNTEESTEILKEIEACAKKINIEYPNIKSPIIKIQYKELNADRNPFRYHLGDYRIVEAIMVSFTEESIK